MRRLFIFAVALLAFGCSSYSGIAPKLSNITPQTFQKHVNKIGWVVIPISPIDGFRAQLSSLAVDNQHKMWVAAAPNGNDPNGGGELVKILMNGHQTRYPLSVLPGGLVSGPDGNMWTDGYEKASGTSVIARVTLVGQETDFPLNLPSGLLAGYFILGPDGAFWFGACNRSELGGGVGRVDTAGKSTFYPGPCAGVIASGPDGNIWFGDIGQNIYKMNTQGNLLATYPVGDQRFNGLTVGSDGAMYTAAEAIFNNEPDLVRVSIDGVVTHIGNDPYRGGYYAILSGPDGNLWISSPRSVFGYLEQFNVATQTWGEIVKAPKRAGDVLATGPDGNIWATASNESSVDTYIIQAMTVRPKELTILVGHHAGLDVTEANYSGGWTAVATDPAIASVTPKSQSGTFEVTGVAPGTASVTVYDSMYNSISVKITVN